MADTSLIKKEKISKNNKNLKIVVQIFKEGYRPSGQTDKGGRWYPDEDEKASCCEKVRYPSRSFPWSLWKHCHTAKHIRTLIQERPSPTEKEALTMTVKKAPLYLNDPTYLKEVAKKLLQEPS